MYMLSKFHCELNPIGKGIYGLKPSVMLEHTASTASQEQKI